MEFFKTQQGICTDELTVVVPEYLRPTQAQIKQNPSTETEVGARAKEQLIATGGGEPMSLRLISLVDRAGSSGQPHTLLGSTNQT